PPYLILTGLRPTSAQVNAAICPRNFPYRRKTLPACAAARISDTFDRGGIMFYGVFDHLDRGSAPLGEYYHARLKRIEAHDRMGFYAYHLAEHHGTPIGMAPSPNVFLSAVAQRTRRLRFGPLVYALPLHHPLRLVEEICMLDQMSGGRLEIGFGRGAST